MATFIHHAKRPGHAKSATKYTMTREALPDTKNHFVALCGVNVEVPLEHPCWAKKWYFNQGGEIKTCLWWVEVVKASLDLTGKNPITNNEDITVPQQLY